VIIQPPPATLQAIALTPSSASLTAGATQQFTATGKMSDGSISTITVTWTATGGVVSSTGLYTAGQSSGTFRVIATESGGSLADTATISITAPTPSPAPSGTTYFSADAESGTISPWSESVQNGGNPLVVSSTTRARSGTHSYKHEITNYTIDAYKSMLHSYAPQTSMGSPDGSRYTGGYYSWWVYIDSGYITENAWNLHMGWMTGVSGAPQPIANIGLEVHGGVLQVVFTARNSGPQTQCPSTLCGHPNISGYTNVGNGWYYQTASSPNGITALPRGQWVHLTAWTNFQRTNGHVKVWQDGTLIMDLTAPTLNTYDGMLGSNTSGGMIVQFGIYGGPQSQVMRIYTDDFKVTDYLPAQ